MAQIQERVSVSIVGEDDDSSARVYTVGIQKALPGKPGAPVDVSQGNSLPDELTDLWTGTPLISPPLPVEGLVVWYARSKILPPYVKAMAQGVTGYGWELKPTINLEGENAAEEVETAMALNRLSEYEDELDAWNQKDEASKPKEPEPPTPKEVEITLTEWRKKARMEKAKIEVKLPALVFEGPWDELNRQQEIGQNIVGWGSWEVMRAPNSRRINRLKKVEPYTLRLTAACDPVKVTEFVPISKVHYKAVQVARRYRKIAQLGTSNVWFKAFGDPRVMSAMSGEFYVDKEELATKEPNAPEATEILWFADYFPGTPYGMPPSHGITPEVRGSRLAADNVVDDLLNASIPRGMLLTSDVRLGKDLKSQIQAFFSARHGQMRNRLLVVEAMTARSGIDTAGNVHAKIDYIPMKKEQNDDATFLEYQKQAGIDAGSQFGIPRILVGGSDDYNRATADAARQSAEETVFAPRRRRFDDVINRTILKDMGVQFWLYVSCSPTQTELEKVSKLLLGAMKEGAITPVEARPLLADLLSVTLTEEAGQWQRQPMAMTLAGMQPPDDTTGEDAVDAKADGDKAKEEAAESSALQKELAALLEYGDVSGKADALAKALVISGRTPGEQMTASMGPADHDDD